MSPPTSVLSPPTIRILPAGTSLHRNHASGFRAAQFNPCQGQRSRFAPFVDTSGDCVPTIYAAETRESAAFESIFHDVPATARYKTVRSSVVLSRTASEIKPRRDLSLAQLFGPDLKAWGLRRDQLIDTPRSTYAATALWAKALHDQFPQLDGLVWTSRQCDPQICMVLFGNRVSEGDFDVIDSQRVDASVAVLQDLRTFGLRAGITITG